MNRITRVAATAVTSLALALPAVGVAQAQAAPAPTPTTLAAATCHYTVNGNGVAVRRAPHKDAYVIKRKNRGAHVTGPCNYYGNWTRVYLGGGGTGWMNSAFLLR